MTITVIWVSKQSLSHGFEKTWKWGPYQLIAANNGLMGYLFVYHKMVGNIVYPKHWFAVECRWGRSGVPCDDVNGAYDGRRPVGDNVIALRPERVRRPSAVRSPADPFGGVLHRECESHLKTRKASHKAWNRHEFYLNGWTQQIDHN